MRDGAATLGLLLGQHQPGGSGFPPGHAQSFLLAL